MRRLITYALVGVLSVALNTAAPATALPVVPDDLNVFPHSDIQAHPSISVTDENGNPITKPVHRGDILYVHGSGFDPGANRGGFIFPIPPGVPNGVYVLYSGLANDWKPSEKAPSSARQHPHDRMAWMLTESSLAAVPDFPVDMRRVLARVAQPMHDDGSFLARIVVDPPATTAGDQYGVYTYAAAASINPDEELFIPIPFDPSPGPRTSIPTRDLLVDASGMEAVTSALRGGIGTREGADRTDDEVSYTKEADQPDGVIRYKGVVLLKAKFSTLEVAVANPWLHPRREGGYSVSAEISRGLNLGTDSMQRTVIGHVDAASGTQTLHHGIIDLATLTFAS
ncbi:HtaA protein [Corynebacterium sp. ES2794-CONJ1]|uniref:HtaA protein n=1 Tax=Corynebacterium sp. ES2794-CONJ1 TaxID=2980553 RepID=UPI0021DACDDA|nr:HtaA protein [Corynebacterium sp. ES2794-CONJ1]MCU9519782.1 HtaA protein [Corynebacterium sp. ES2794-CONJ1]